MPLLPTFSRIGRGAARCFRLAATPSPPARGAATATAAGATPTPAPVHKRSRGRRNRIKPPPPATPHPPRCPLPPLPPGAVDPPSYAPRLDHKVAALSDLLAGVGALPSAPLAVYASPPAGYRARAEFRVWHEGGDLHYVMFDDRAPFVASGDAGVERPPGGAAPASPSRVKLEAFPIGTPLMNVLMTELMAALREEPGAPAVVEGGDDGPTPTPPVKKPPPADPSVSPLRARLFQANFLTTLAGGAVVTLVYHRPLGDDWAAAAEGLRARLERAAAAGAVSSGGAWAAGRVDVVGRSRGQRVDVAANHTTEVLDLGHGRTPLTYRYVEGAFSQPNPAVCGSMLAWAAAAAGGCPPTDGGADPTPPGPTASRPDDLLELYCGGGTFTAALAPSFRRTLATEVARTLVAAAAVNLASNGLGDGDGDGTARAAGSNPPVVLVRADAGDVATALANCEAAAAAGLDALPPPTPDADPPPMRIGGRSPGAVDPRGWDLDTLFVDPPRAGVGPACAASLFPRFDRILYISCNPATLAADVAGLVGGGGGAGGDGAPASHVPVAAALFDQFPYTDHIECGLLLERRRR